MTDQKCKWEQDEVCVNADCPLCADFCSVCYTPGVCRFEDRRKAQSGSEGVLAPLGGMRDV